MTIKPDEFDFPTPQAVLQPAVAVEQLSESELDQARALHAACIRALHLFFRATKPPHLDAPVGTDGYAPKVVAFVIARLRDASWPVRYEVGYYSKNIRIMPPLDSNPSGPRRTTALSRYGLE